jgi:hypothetical protein
MQLLLLSIADNQKEGQIVQGGKSTYNWLDGLGTSSCCANALALLSSRLERYNVQEHL